MNENASNTIFNFHQWLALKFEEKSSYRASACCSWESLFTNSDKELTKYILKK